MTRRLGYVPALDGVRGLAIAAVVVYHAFDVPGGFLGVDLFFVLSGFLITTLLLEEHAEKGRLDFSAFYLRRARRLLPVALAGIFFAQLIVISAALAGGNLGTQVLGGLFASLYVANLAHFLDPPVILGIGHYWSLSQEEQFYIVWPPLLAMLLVLRVRLRWLVAGLALAVIAVVAHRALLVDAGWWRTYYAPDTRSDGILLGCLLAVAWKDGRLRESRLWLAAGPVALAVYGVAVATLDHTTRATALYGLTVANVAAAAILASIIMAPHAPITRVLSLPPLRWLGLISYSLYIWGSLVGWVTQAHGWLLVTLSIAVAVLSYRFVERPFRLRRAAQRVPGSVRPAPAASTTG
jgi:peptidoglycan/LPS O-acetylase OafA/YrhL